MQIASRRAILDGMAARTVAELGQTVCAAIAAPSTVLARVWARDEAGTLTLLASAGFPLGGGSYHRIDGEFRRIDGGTGKIAQIAATRQAFIVRGIRGDEEWLSNPGWIARQGVRAFLGFPLVSDNAVLGVLARFDRTLPTDETLADLEFVAEFLAARLRDLAPVPTPIVTRGDLRALERRSIEIALTRTKGKVFGADGAAALLQMKPTTLASRMKTLGIT